MKKDILGGILVQKTPQFRAGSGASPRTVRDISPIEQTVNAFEYAAWHFGSAFARWRHDCLGATPANALGGTEASILHVLHLNGTAKGLSDVARLLHRDDLANLQ